MKKLLQISRLSLMIGLLTVTFSSQAFAIVHLHITPDAVVCAPGDSIQMAAAYVDSLGMEKDTTVTWSVRPKSLGDFSDPNYFIALKTGEGFIYAEIGDLIDSVTVTISDSIATGSKYPRLKIQPNNAEVFVGDSVQFQALYCVSADSEFDTTVVWSAFPDSIGYINSNGMFYGQLPGESIVTATIDTLEAWVEVGVFQKEENEDFFTYQHLIVLPKDTLINVGDMIKFTAYQVTDSGTIGDTIKTVDLWNVLGMSCGSVDSTGTFKATESGFALIEAIVGEHSGTALVIVNDTTPDPTGINTIILTRTTNNPRGYSVIDTLQEGDIWIVGGLPHPMNILNGSGIYFPIGCLKEDIRIYVNLPDFARVGTDTVEFSQPNVVNGVNFQVYAQDTLSEPYYFEKPLGVGIVFKRGLLDHLGIDPLSLSLVYAEVQGDSIAFDQTGTAYTTLDLTSNRIYSTVAHFSSLVITGDVGTSVKIVNSDEKQPTNFHLSQNYPNPFNPSTVIRYQIPKDEMVKVSVYNLAGHLIETLVSERQTAGNYQVRWNAERYASGIYFYEIQAGTFKAVKRAILLK